MKNSYTALKSGTDIRGVASDVFGSQVTLTDQAVRKITASFVKWLSEKAQKPTEQLTVAVGHDSRITAQTIKKGVIETLCALSVKVYDCALASTPAMFMTTIDTDADGAIQITASHHPADRNGLKFFVAQGGLNSSDINQIVSDADQLQLPAAKDGVVERLEFMQTYSKRLRGIICNELGADEFDMPLKGFHIVVDAGNGVGGFYATEVLQRLGARIDGSLFLDPDGMFPNHIPNPEDKAAMKSICDAVKNSGADLGVIFDTDVDRAGCVDSSGNEINRNRLIALSAAIVIENNPGATIVTDSVTSDGLKEFIEQRLLGRHHRFKRGYKNVINEAIRLCDEGINSPLAIETSGHAALKENYFLDDGAYLITKIIVKMVKLKQSGSSLEGLTAELKTPVEAEEIRFGIKAEDFKQYGNQVICELEKFAAEKEQYKIADDNHEGIRVSTPQGWFLLRLSVHDPIMPFNVESNIEGGVQIMLQQLKVFFEDCELLDITPFSEKIKKNFGR